MKIRLALAFAIPAAWTYQFVLHRTWIFYPAIAQDHLGMPLFAAAIVILSFPLLLWKAIRPLQAVPILHWPSEYRWIGLLTMLAALNWLLVAWPWLGLPQHTYGDEFFHNIRTAFEFDYWHKLFISGGRVPADFPAAHFIFYPSLAYFTTTLLAWLQGDAGSIVFQRQAQLFWLLPIPALTYVLGRLLDVARWPMLLFAAVIACSPLLASFTISYYIELPYISIELASLIWLVTAWKKRDVHSMCMAVGFASLATLVRESTLPFAVVIALAAAWTIRGIMQDPISRRLLQGWFLIAAILPCAVYSYARKLYAGPDSTRLAIGNLPKQEWSSLLIYCAPYLNTVLLLLGLASLRWLLRSETRRPSLVLASALAGTLLMYGMFLPGWMPWSRNYALLFVPVTGTCLLGLYWLWATGRRRLASGMLAAAFICNITVSALWFKDNTLFHENEAMFDLAPALAILSSQPGQISVYEHRPAFMIQQLPLPANVKLINEGKDSGTFLPWEELRDKLPAEARWVLYYYYENRSKPPVLNALKRTPKLNTAEIDGFTVRSAVDDPFSGGRTGVMLLMRDESP